MAFADPVPRADPSLPGVRVRAALGLAALLVALAGLIAWQTRSGLGHVARMMRERSAALHDAAAREVRNVVRFGSGRRERLDEVLRAIVGGPDVSGVLLERRDGALRLAHGELPAAGALRALAAGVRVAGETTIVAGPLRLETRGCHEGDAPRGGGCAGCGPVCPAAGDSTLDGDYRLVVAFAAGPYLELQRAVRWQGLAGGALLVGLAVALWLFARQSSRAGEMRAALAAAGARARYLERLTVVAGGLAHEIKNPVSALRGFAQLIGESAAVGSKEAEYAELMVAELDAINRRVDGLRHFARPSAPALRPCHPAAVLRRVAALLAPDAAARDVRLALELPPEPDLEVPGDEERLRELTVNLLVNAIDASPAGGTVRAVLRVAREPSPAFLLEVADEGPGIPFAERELALRPFHSTKPGGLGLGLALAQRAVEDHGGQLEIDDGPEGGAVLRARWPIGGP